MMGNTTNKSLNGDWTVRIRDGKISIDVYDHEKDQIITIPMKNPNMAIGLGNALLGTGVRLEWNNGYEL